MQRQSEVDLTVSELKLSRAFADARITSPHTAAALECIHYCDVEENATC